ncbi:MAG: ABC transporter permease [Trueperaceae bacterium]|nr:ABC transporter permease [Trueperaceae bacterium]
MSRTHTNRTGWFRVVAAVIAANLRRLSNDRTALVFMVAVPFLLILIIGVAVPSPDDAGPRPLGAVAPPGPGLAAQVMERLRADPMLDVTSYPDEAALRAAVRRGREVAGVVVPADVEDRLRRGAPTKVTFLTDPSRAPPMTVRTHVLRVVAEVGASMRSARFVAEGTGISLEAALAATGDVPVFGSTDVVSETYGEARAALLGGFAFAAPRYLVLFVFINTLVAAWGMPADRAAGLARRTFAAPTGATALLLGEAGYRMLVAVLQAALIVVVGAVAFGVAWGDPWGVAALIALLAAVSTGAAVLLGSLARTPQQITALAPPIGIALGMLGGCMWPLEIVGPTLRAIAHATPHAWAVQAFTRLVGDGAGLSDITRELAVLASFAAVFLAMGLVAYRRALRDGPA